VTEPLLDELWARELVGSYVTPPGRTTNRN
jgi:hypothetical protein